MLSAFITSIRGYSAVLLAEQPMHRWYVHPGPLVLRTAPLKYPTPTTDRDRTVSPNLPVDVNSWGRSACYPQGSFYPLSDGISTHYRLITNSNFRFCSTCRSHSQAGFCVCTLCTISVRAEPTFERLRYSLGGDRPSQTAHLTLSPTSFQK